MTVESPQSDEAFALVWLTLTMDIVATHGPNEPGRFRK